MKEIKRVEIDIDKYKEIFKKESHHSHPIIEDDSGIIRWKKNPDIDEFLKKISLNDLCHLLDCIGYGKNSEVYRELYRNMGYSLSGYWEIFYWEANNPEFIDYRC